MEGFNTGIDNLITYLSIDNNNLKKDKWYINYLDDESKDSTFVVTKIFKFFDFYINTDVKRVSIDVGTFRHKELKTNIKLIEINLYSEDFKIDIHYKTIKNIQKPSINLEIPYEVDSGTLFLLETQNEDIEFLTESLIKKFNILYKLIDEKYFDKDIK